MRANKGGRKAGTTKAQKRQNKSNLRDAKNWITKGYAAERDEAKRTGGRVPDKTLTTLVQSAAVEFNLPSDFTMSRQTVSARIKSGNLEVAHPGEVTPLAPLEVILSSYIVAAWRIKKPLTCGQTYQLANSLILRSDLAKEFKEWKMKRGLYDDDEDANLLGSRWFQGFRKRNEGIFSDQVGRKYERNRHEHVTYQAFERQFSLIESGLTESGNARMLDQPQHQDREGNVVSEDEAFGYPVTLEFIHPENVFACDETGDKCGGKDDARNGGEKRLVPNGVIPKALVGISSSHFTVFPVSNFTGQLVLVQVIFKGSKFKASWGIGIDIFAKELDAQDDPSVNFGPGKRYPGLSIFCNGIEVITLFDASPKASMTSSILRNVVKTLDDQKLTKRGPGLFPAIILDGHVSRTGEAYLEYVTDTDTEWMAMFLACYGTEIGQLHDDKRQNGAFKTALSKSKESFVAKKRRHGAKPEILQNEIVIVLQEPIQQSFADVQKTKRALADRGLNPWNRAPLDDPVVLATATDSIQAERNEILTTRNLVNPSAAVPVPPTRMNLLQTGSGSLLGGEAAAAEAVAAAAQSLNTTGGTSMDILTMLRQESAKDAGRQRHHESQKDCFTEEELAEIYANSKKLTANTVFGTGDGRMGRSLYNEVRKRSLAKSKKDAEKANRDKKKIRILLKKAKATRKREKDYLKWKREEILDMIRLKKLPKDKWNLPKTKGEMQTRWAEIKGRRTPHASPCNSDNEESDAEDDESIDSQAEPADEGFVIDSDDEIAAEDDADGDGDEDFVG